MSEGFVSDPIITIGPAPALENPAYSKVPLHLGKRFSCIRTLPLWKLGVYCLPCCTVQVSSRFAKPVNHPPSIRGSFDRGILGPSAIMDHPEFDRSFSHGIAATTARVSTNGRPSTPSPHLYLLGWQNIENFVPPRFVF